MPCFKTFREIHPWTINSYQPSKKAGLARGQIKGHNDITRVATPVVLLLPGKKSQLGSLR